jgi:hypothetical protein
VQLSGTSHLKYPAVRPSSLLSKTGNYTLKPTWEKYGSKINIKRKGTTRTPQ